MREFLELAHALADAAAGPQRRYFRTPVAVDTKADESPVTIADREAEAAMRELIGRRFPSHGILGEEYGAERTDAEHVWVLDPIDGTKSFITGRPLFGTLIALLRDGVPVLGIIDQSIINERWVGMAGEASTHNGRPIRVRPAPSSAMRSCSPPARACSAPPPRAAAPSSASRTRSGCRCSVATATPTASWPWDSPTS
jgi:inositol-phosphate phosphatase/L-galactose 1-phosphate phosphatase/histidinol-phosphatase